MTGLYIAAAIAILLLLWAILTYNSLVRARNRVDESWSGIDVQLKRRHDLVPNLVETVEGYAAHERGTLTAVTEARSSVAAALRLGERASAETGLSAALSQVMAVGERYPELRASESFKRLQAQIAEVEDEIQAARHIYNSNVQLFNTRVQTFPTSVIASVASLRPREFFRMELTAERARPEAAFARAAKGEVALWASRSPASRRRGSRRPRPGR